VVSPGTCVSDCATSNGGCDANANCSLSSEGAVECACNAGYFGDGTTCNCRGFTVTSVDNELCALFSENTDACAECVSDSDDVGNDDVLYCFNVNNGKSYYYASFFNDEYGDGLANFLAKYDNDYTGYGIAASINAYIASNGDGGAYNNNVVFDGGTTINFFFCSAQDP